MSRPVLAVTGLAKRFGGLLAVRDVSLDLEAGEIHAVIGPNGAGKTTLINLLSGDLKPSGGSIRFAGRDIAGLSADRIARLGIGRSYQKTNIFPAFTVFENCRLAVQARRRSSLRFFRPAASYKELGDAADHALAEAGLDARAGAIAATLSHGEQRQLELAMTLATEPQILLLDEPLAGMGAEEALRIVALLRRIAAGRAMLLVEHDMDAVFSLADRLTVMVNGSVLESGAPDRVRASAAVQEAYLGAAVEHA